MFAAPQLPCPEQLLGHLATTVDSANTKAISSLIIFPQRVFIQGGKDELGVCRLGRGSGSASVSSHSPSADPLHCDSLLDSPRASEDPQCRSSERRSFANTAWKASPWTNPFEERNRNLCAKEIWGRWELKRGGGISRVFFLQKSLWKASTLPDPPSCALILPEEADIPGI
jgi:hypothetical protein